MNKQPVVVVGAGVIGLSVANQLQEDGKYNVTIVAEHVPDSLPAGTRESTGWASPWAGAHWRAWSSNWDHWVQDMELQTYHLMNEIAERTPESGISKAQGLDYFETLPDGERPWYVSKVNDIRELPAGELPPGITYGLEYSTVLINVPQYLTYLKNKFEGLGGTIEQRSLDHIEESLLFGGESSDKTPIVVNCAALGNRVLGGVCDLSMRPVRGQTLVVNAPDAKRTLTRLGSQFGYVIPRGDGTVVLGGTAEAGSWEEEEDRQTTQRILQRTLALEPSLLPPSMLGLSESERVRELQASVIYVGVGFRPMREGGVRLEAQEYVDSVSAKPFTVIHCYGHAGFGYQTSLGYARRVREMIESM
ncbi:hypothetical protein IWW39_003652 [Coemansia spiralis]|uniref:FAD dependent oxidoreductase domain-containing protein n=1 Tax=Coemansia spiralis TaxID=417178 RepID=A0A9W8GKS2_9FUNG|nr:hypothetical protein IWW39_003652 [Coemansia spiralis]